MALFFVDILRPLYEKNQLDEMREEMDNAFSKNTNKLKRYGYQVYRLYL